MYNNLDLNEFFKDEYSKVNYSEGIGGVGIITENQIVNVYNDYKLCKQDNKYYLGLGDHLDKFEELLKDMYGDNISYYDSYLSKLIQLKYWNCPYFKIIGMFFPTEITEKEFSNLLLLKDYYKEVFDKYRITIGAYTFGSNVRENGPEVECYSNLEPIYEHISKRVNKSLTRKIKDKKIII